MSISEIKMLQPYQFFGMIIPGGITLTIGLEYNGHVLKQKHVDAMIKGGFAEEVE